MGVVGKLVLCVRVCEGVVNFGKIYCEFVGVKVFEGRVVEFWCVREEIIDVESK